MADLLQEALIAKEGGDLVLAKQLISQALIQKPSNEAAWMLMADVVEDVRLRRNCLERVLSINPDNTSARSALSKLNTSPLTPTARGERDQLFNPPTIEKVPPFTPPFTWEGNEEQLLAVGDMTYPELSENLPTSPVDAVPTFDWATESEEPDKAIQKIFDTISNPDLASQPLPDTDISLAGSSAAPGEGRLPSDSSEYENMLLDQLVGSVEEKPETPSMEREFSVEAEPQLGLDAFTSPEQALETVTPDYRLWDNPRARQDRMIILSNKSLMIANPKESDVPHILGLFAENRMMRDLLGESAGVIRLESIRRVVAEPRYSSMTIEYKKETEHQGKKKKQKDEKPLKFELKLANPQVLEEVMGALQVRLGAGFGIHTHTFSMVDKIMPPVVSLIVIAIIAWGLIMGVPLLSKAEGMQQEPFFTFLANLNAIITGIGPFNILLLAVLGATVVVIWLLSNLRQPSKLLTMER